MREVRCWPSDIPLVADREQRSLAENSWLWVDGKICDSVPEKGGKASF